MDLQADPDLIQALAAWRLRLGSVGVACRQVAFFAEDLRWRVRFPDVEQALVAKWDDLRGSVSAEKPVAMAKIGHGDGVDLLLATALQLPDGQFGVIGVVLAPPYNDRTIQLVLLSQGWLQLSLAAASMSQNRRAARLLELLGYVSSQVNARSAAQEWVNRSANLAREEDPATAKKVSLMLFRLTHGAPKWWVAADTAWAETGSPAVQAATELATQATAEHREVLSGDMWALPIIDHGELVAVLVAQAHDLAGQPWPQTVMTVLRASISVSEPLMRRWHEAEQGLVSHAWTSLRGVWQKWTGAGHLSWKAGSLAVVLTMAILVWWPVTDWITANTVIEGQQRQMVTAPFDGFIAKVNVRPGERVRKGQEMAGLDDRDLLLEQANHRSERDQALGKLRQAMAERDASAVALAQAELQQAEAQLALADTKLARTALLAPMDGLVVIGDWSQQIGSPIEMGKEMFEIANTDGYRVVLHVPDRDIAQIKPGQTGRVRLTGFPESAFPFRVIRVTAVASVEDNVNGFRVEAVWVGRVPPLSPGMQGVGKIDAGTSNLLTVWTRSSLDWLRLKFWTWLW